MIEFSHGKEHNKALAKRSELSESDTADDAAQSAVLRLHQLKQHQQVQPQQPPLLQLQQDSRAPIRTGEPPILSDSPIISNFSTDEELPNDAEKLDDNNNKSKSSSSNNNNNNNNNGLGLAGFQLRAFSDDISALQANPWIPASTLPAEIQVSSFSAELVNETLNYFVNCRQRLNQMTKTYDDNDAYILLLQEKEVDLELAARIGQDLLKQNTQLRESIRSLEDELVQKQDYVQQLKHELASKASLLDTFIEEEEQQTSLSSKHHQDEEEIILSSIKPSTDQQKLVSTVTFQLVESNKRLCELQDELTQKGEQNLKQQELIFRLQDQLKDSDRRLGDILSENESLQRTIMETSERKNELYEELKLCKQNFSELLCVFMELQRESREYRLRETQQNSNFSFINELDPLNDEINHHQNNISFDSFDYTSLDTYRSTPFNEFNHNLNLNHHHHQQQQQQQQQNHATQSNAADTTNSLIRIKQKQQGAQLSTSLHEELRESMQKMSDIDSEAEHSSGEEGTDGGDSGVHTRAKNKTATTSASITPSTTLTDTANCFSTILSATIEEDTDSDESSSSCSSSSQDNDDGGGDHRRQHHRHHHDRQDLDSGKNWLGISSFMVSTLVLLGLSVTFNSPANSSVAQKLQTNCLNAFLKS